MEREPIDLRCGICSATRTVLAGDRESPCTACGADAREALRAKDDVVVRVNWHELRILGIWAERWAALIEGDPGLQAQRTVARIAGRIHAQEPDRPGLTLSGEIADLRRSGADVEVKGFREDPEANAD